jgi:beta-N-acetylhexosaminidase
MKLNKIALSIIASLILSGCNESEQTQPIDEQAQAIVKDMTLEQKVAQKIMMSFRYWCEDSQNGPDCYDGMTELPETIASVINETEIGGVILFANNQPNLKSTAKLIHDMQSAVVDESKLGLFMALDQEGGNVIRLPRDVATNFSGNMALGAAYLNTEDKQLAYKQGQALGSEVASVGFNFNMAPVVDVQSNPLNPVINVRSYGENPELVGTLGGEVSKGMASEGVIASMKHFPGHGDVASDSHYGLPVVNRTKEEAFTVDLAPYKTAIDNGIAPDMIMTAHIQYPSLDDTQIITKDGTAMIAPATLSYKIQHEILRNELGYEGLTITDALDMKGISDFFEENDAVIKVFQAGVDIALMPTQFKTPEDAVNVEKLIDDVVEAIEAGDISEEALNESVERIVKVKLKRGILNFNDSESLEDRYELMENTIGSTKHRDIEKEIAQKSLTLVQNNNETLPMTTGELGKIHILTPWGEQGTALRMGFEELGVQPSNISNVKFSQTNWNDQVPNIDAADTIIVGSLSSGISPVEINGDPNSPAVKAFSTFAQDLLPLSGSLVFNVENEQAPVPFSTTISNAQFARYALEYAKEKGKKTILLSLRAPYDTASYYDTADVMIATYNYYGYDYGYLRGPSLIEVPKVILGTLPAQGKLPVSVNKIDPDGNLGEVLFEYGHSAAQID